MLFLRGRLTQSDILQANQKIKGKDHIGTNTKTGLKIRKDKNKNRKVETEIEKQGRNVF